MKRAERAKKLFREDGLCCSQSVLSVFASSAGLDRESATGISAPFCGGIAHTGSEICGAVSGGIMAIGLNYNPGRRGEKRYREITDRLAEKFMERFRRKHGSIRCRELLGYCIGIEEEIQIVREKGLFDRVCRELVGSAVEMVEEITFESPE